MPTTPLEKRLINPCRAMTCKASGLHGFIAVAQLKRWPHLLDAQPCVTSPRLHRRGPIEAVALLCRACSAWQVSTASSPWPN